MERLEGLERTMQQPKLAPRICGKQRGLKNMCLVKWSPHLEESSMEKPKISKQSKMKPIVFTAFLALKLVSANNEFDDVDPDSVRPELFPDLSGTWRDGLSIFQLRLSQPYDVVVTKPHSRYERTMTGKLFCNSKDPIVASHFSIRRDSPQIQ